MRTFSSIKYTYKRDIKDDSGMVLDLLESISNNLLRVIEEVI